MKKKFVLSYKSKDGEYTYYTFADNCKGALDAFATYWWMVMSNYGKTIDVTDDAVVIRDCNNNTIFRAFDFKYYTVADDGNIISAESDNINTKKGERTVKKDYHEYEKFSLGFSDSAFLIMSGVESETRRCGATLLRFGKDGEYRAYFVDELAEIGNHYEIIERYSNWLKIYDDSDLTVKIEANEIIVYRSGQMGCIIQMKGWAKVTRYEHDIM